MSFVPMDPYCRDRVMRDAGIHEWYRKAGYTVEQNEYKSEPERKGWHDDKEGQRVSHRVLSLDAMLDGQEETEMSSSYSGEVEDGFEFDQPDETDDVATFEDEPVTKEAEFLTELVKVVPLTKGEQRVTEWVLAGNQVTGADYTQRMADALGVTQNAAKFAWTRSRNKLLARTEGIEFPARGPRLVQDAQGAGLWPTEYPADRKVWTRDLGLSNSDTAVSYKSRG